MDPFRLLKKIRENSPEEIRTRGSQTFSIREEGPELKKKEISDSEFLSILDKNLLGSRASARDLKELFYDHTQNTFFLSLFDKAKTLEALSKLDPRSKVFFIEKAEMILAGKISLLGYENLNFDTPINWHYEPISKKHIPLKPWHKFDELETEEIGDRRIVWELNRHQHFFTLGVAYWITEDEIFAETFVNHLTSWMQQNPPGMGINWFSSLEAAFRLISWLWALHFFKDSPSISPEVFLKVLKFLYYHGHKIEMHLSTYHDPNMYLTGEALGLYYLGTQVPFFTESERWLQIGERILLKEIERQVWDDGVHFEQSSCYARYMADFYIHYLILCSLFQRKNYTELVEQRLQLLLDFLMNITHPDGTTPLIGDDDGGKMLPLSHRALNDFRPTLATAAILFNRPDYKFVARNAVEEALWLLGAKGLEQFDKLPSIEPEQTSRFFNCGGYFVMRDGWDENDNFLLIDAGPMGAMTGGHSHADTLSIEVAALGKKILVDSGTYSYHESDKIRNYFRSTLAHNTLSIDRKSSSEFGGKFDWQTKANATIHRQISETRFDFIEASHDGYTRLESPAIHTRSVLFLKNDYWILRDFVGTSGKHDYYLNFHFDSTVGSLFYKKEHSGKCFVEQSCGDSFTRIFNFGDNGDWHFREGWVSDCYGRCSKAPVFQFLSSAIGPQEFFTFIMPDFPDTERKPEVDEIEVVGARAFVIDFRGYKDIFIYTDGEQKIYTEFLITDFRFVWVRVTEEHELPEEYVLIDGKNFFLMGREIVNRPFRIDFALARRFGVKLNVRTDDSVFSVSLPQHC